MPAFGLHRLRMSISSLARPDPDTHRAPKYSYTGGPARSRFAVLRFGVYSLFARLLPVFHSPFR